MKNWEIQELFSLRDKVLELKKESTSEDLLKVIKHFDELFKGFEKICDEYDNLASENDDLEYERDDLMSEVNILEGEILNLKYSMIRTPENNLPTTYVYEKVYALLLKYGPYKLEEKLNKL